MSVEKILNNYSRVITKGYVKTGGLKYNNYVVSNLRGGVGKSTLSFNLSFEMSKNDSLLVADLCPQCNLTEVYLRGSGPKLTVYDALRPRLLGPAFGEPVKEVSVRVSKYCDSFLNHECYFIPGDPEMFAFPSPMYQQLQLASASPSRSEGVVRKLLLSLKDILDNEMKIKDCNKSLLDTSPFYSGGTHLSWCAADALIVPVRVDEHSIESLGLTFRMLTDTSNDFVSWNERAGGLPIPKIAAVVMTMVGSKSQKKATPDAASCMYINRALEIAEKYSSLFDYEDPSDAFVLLDDFLSSGRISGAKSIPISELNSGQFHTVQGSRLQVNSSVERYKNQLRYLVSIL